MPYNFQGAGGIINTGPVRGIYYLTPSFTTTLFPQLDSDAATKAYVDQGLVKVNDSDIAQPYFTQSTIPAGRIVITVTDRVGGGRNIVFTLDTDSVDTAQLATNAVETINITDANVTLAKLASDITVSSLPIPTTTLNMGSNRIENVARPANPGDATNMAYVDSEIAALVDGAPDALNTLRELAQAINDDSDVYNTLITFITNRTNIDSDSLIRSSGRITVAPGGIDTDRIADRAVTNMKIGLLAVDIPEIATTNTPTADKILHTVVDTDTDGNAIPGSYHLEWVTASQASIANNSIGPSQVNANLAGAGLIKPGLASPIRVDTDFGLELTADTDTGRLRVDTDVIATRQFVIDNESNTLYQADTETIQLDTDTNTFRVDTDEIATRRYVTSTIPDVFGDTEKGLVPNPNSAERNARHYLRADGQWGAENFTGSASGSTVTIRETTSAGGSRARVQLNFSKPGTGNTAAGLTFTFTYPDGSTRTHTLPNNIFYQNISNANQLVLRLQTNYEFNSIEGIGNIDYDAFSSTPTITFDFLDVGSVGNTPVSVSGNTNFSITNTIVSQGTPDVDTDVTDVTIQLDTDSDDGLATRGYVDSSISAEQSARASAISAEQSARLAADAQLQSAINSEISNRQTGDSNLSTRIDSEGAVRLAADNALDARIDSEVIALENYVDTHEGVLDTDLSAGRGIIIDAGTKHSINVDTDDTLTFDSNDRVGVADNSLQAVKLAGAAAPASGSQQYALQVDSDGTKSFAAVDVASSLGELTDVTTSNDTERDLLSYDNGMWRNSQVLGIVNEGGINYLEDIFGMRLVNRIEFLSFAFASSFSFAPSPTLNMDQIATSLTARNTNDTDFPSEYVDTLGVTFNGSSVYTDTPDTSINENFARTLTATNIGTTSFQDSRTTSYQSNSLSHSQTLVLSFTTNLGTTETRNATYTWRAAPEPSFSVGGLSSLRFDQVRRSYSITTSYSNLSLNSTIGSTSIIPDTGRGDSESLTFTNFSNVTNFFTADTSRIYHNTSFNFSYTSDVVRPQFVYANTLSEANRTRNWSGSQTVPAPTTIFRFWSAVDTESDSETFVASDLGTLDALDGYNAIPSNVTGYADSTNASAWQGYNPDNGFGTYSITNPSATNAATYFIIVPTSGALSGTQTFRLPDALDAEPIYTTRTLNLGQSVAQVNYTVYGFSLPAGGSARFQIRAS